MKNFAERLRGALAHAKMTPYGLSTQVGLTANYVSRVLNSAAAQHERANVRTATLDKMSHVLGVRREWLGFGEEPMIRPDARTQARALLSPLDVAILFLGAAISESAVVAVEAWARKHDPRGYQPLAWGKLLVDAHRQLQEGREPIIPPPAELNATLAQMPSTPTETAAPPLVAGKKKRAG